MPILTAVAGVLIETYWNVKLFFTGNRWYLYNRINRNILECKGIRRNGKPGTDWY